MSEWIDIAERYPFEHQRVLISDGFKIYIGNPMPDYSDGKLTVMVETQQHDLAEFVSSKYWMKLPEHPKE